MNKALEFPSKVGNNQIQIPLGYSSDFSLIESKNILKVVSIEKPLFIEDESCKTMAQVLFHEGYSASDVSYKKK